MKMKVKIKAYKILGRKNKVDKSCNKWPNE